MNLSVAGFLTCNNGRASYIYIKLFILTAWLKQICHIVLFVGETVPTGNKELCSGFGADAKTEIQVMSSYRSKFLIRFVKHP